MSTQAQILANRQNAQASTGPRSEAGKTRSAANAQTSGLFSKQTPVDPEEAEEHRAMHERLLAELQPATLIEETLVTEIFHAMWRLRRCALLEDTLDLSVSPDEDPAQLAIDRARSQANVRIRRNTEALAKLQTQRRIREENAPAGTGLNQGLIDAKEVLNARVVQRRTTGLHTLESILRATLETPALPENTKRTQFHPAASHLQPASGGFAAPFASPAGSPPPSPAPPASGISNTTARKQ